MSLRISRRAIETCDCALARGRWLAVGSNNSKSLPSRRGGEPGVKADEVQSYRVALRGLERSRKLECVSGPQVMRLKKTLRSIADFVTGWDFVPVGDQDPQPPQRRLKASLEFALAIPAREC